MIGVSAILQTEGKTVLSKYWSNMLYSTFQKFILLVEIVGSLSVVTLWYECTISTKKLEVSKTSFFKWSHPVSMHSSLQEYFIGSFNPYRLLTVTHLSFQTPETKRDYLTFTSFFLSAFCERQMRERSCGKTSQFGRRRRCLLLSDLLGPIGSQFLIIESDKGFRSFIVNGANRGL